VDGHLRFAVGLAAGFLLGVFVHFLSVWGTRPSVQAPEPTRVARDVPSETDNRIGVPAPVERQLVHPVTREVDWYMFTDPTGNQWLIEGMREGVVKPAAYRGELH
jgi:hypothetical protein